MAINGMIQWKGGDQPPADWDGGPVLFRDGTISDLYSEGWDWGRNPSDPPQVRAVEIVAYSSTRSPTPIARLGGDGV